MDGIIEVRVNCASAEEAARIGHAAVERRLAASANIQSPIDSIYRWQGETRAAREVPLVLRSRAGLFDALAGFIAEHHSYVTPGITGIAVDAAAPAYRDWILGGTAAP